MLARVVAFLFLVLWLPTHAAEPDLLEPDKAFRFSARVLGPEALEVRYQIARGYYLYRDKFQFSVQPATVELGAADLPPGELKKDEFFGEVRTYRGELRIRVPIAKASAAGGPVTLAVTSQGCADVGVCYVPHEQTARLNLAAAGAGASGSVSDAPGGLFSSPAAGSSEDDTVIAKLFHGNFALLLLSFFGFGLLLSFTPCVLPMIPILSGVIVGRGAHVTRGHAFSLSAAYVMGMAITYAIAGVLAGLSGAMLSAALQSPWVLGSFAAVFVLLAGAMFGFYELQLPAALQTRLADASNRLPGGHLTGVFAMGALSALIVGPCVAAPLAGALLYISQSRDVVLGGSALFVMALGMGVPLLVVGASAGALLPRVGPWMETVTRFFGVVLLAVAIYLVAPLVPRAVEMLAWAALLVITGIFLRAIDPLPTSARGFDRFAKGLGVIALVAGIAFLIGALAGSRDVLQPLAGLRGASSPAAAPVVFTRVNSMDELDRAISGARGRPVMLDFYADWCVSCKEMERYTFSDPQVSARMSNVVKIQADVTANAPEHQQLLKRFRLFGPPGIVFFDPEGREIQGLRVIGFQPADRFAKVLDQVLAFERVAQ
ncbi:MAG TPA: protein-disulfide reductase DsbD [Burkholderiales bacterium]|nr:protein-disulfide reductase DsbD [Burkholderiales bacterium]